MIRRLATLHLHHETLSLTDQEAWATVARGLREIADEIAQGEHRSDLILVVEKAK